MKIQWIKTTRAAITLVLAILLSNCGGNEPEIAPAPEKPTLEEAAHEEEGHHHTAPHGGALAELPDEIGHLELLLDSDSGTLTLYSLDGSAESAVRLPAQSIVMSVATETGVDTTVTLEPQENALTGKTAGDTSLFRCQAPALKGLERFTGRIDDFTFKGVSIPEVHVRYPEGNE